MAASLSTPLSLLHITTSPSPPSPRFLHTRRLSSAVTLSARPNAPRLRFLSHCSTPFFAGSGGGVGRIDGGDGGGGGGGDGFGRVVPKVSAVDDAAPVSADVIVLNVGGMTCGGCAAKVKKILENQPQVSSATVDLTAETAVVLPATEAMVAPNWRQELGELLAKHLTNCGFDSNPKGQGDDVGENPS